MRKSVWVDLGDERWQWRSREWTQCEPILSNFPYIYMSSFSVLHTSHRAMVRREGALHLIRVKQPISPRSRLSGHLVGSTVTAFTSVLDADGYEVCTVSHVRFPI